MLSDSQETVNTLKIINFPTHIYMYKLMFTLNTISFSWNTYINTLIYTRFSLPEILSINIKQN